MKTLALFLSTLFLHLAGYAQDQVNETHTITIQVENVRNQEGQIHAGLYTKDTFMRMPASGTFAKINDDLTASLTFENIAPGEYAILLYHDQNSNNRMDFENNGMPKEDYAGSGPLTMGPPSWNEYKFTLSEPKEMTIRF